LQSRVLHSLDLKILIPKVNGQCYYTVSKKALRTDL